MTNKQAIDIIHACMHSNNAEILEARDKACIALEKQEPMKVLEVETETVDMDFGICPNCKVNISEGANRNFCGRCGQALDWSGDDD